MKVIGKDRTSCNPCNPIDEILARLDALERRASAIVAKVQGIAPDGEGNVTLPTSSSDTDPLHGRVDAFAMSSEVKEAADDAHAYAASIADDVVVINSEIVALNQAVEALQPAEIEAIKSAVQTLQSTVATLESTVATLNDAIVKKVSKSGDTMTGPLTAPRVDIKSNLMSSSEIPSENQFLDNSSIDRYGTVMVLDRLFRGSNGDIIKQLGISDRSGNFHWVNLLAVTDGGDFATAPSWSPGTNDNSDKILTIKMANSLPSLVHTTGNELIYGTKTFSEAIISQNLTHTYNEQVSEWTWIGNHEIRDKDNVRMGEFRAVRRPLGDTFINESHLIARGANGIDALIIVGMTDNGVAYATVPTPQSNATGNEITTAEWVRNLINQFATANNLNGI